MEITTPIVSSILSHEGGYTNETIADQLSAVTEVRKRKRERLSSHTSELKSSLPPNLQRAMDLSQEKGASNWLTVLPVEEFGFSLHNSAFRDAPRNALRLATSQHPLNMLLWIALLS